jgi:hypothetical protein
MTAELRAASAEDASRDERDSRPAPHVVEQSGPRIKIASGGALALGAWVRAGDHIGVVRGHYRSSAVADLLFERSAGAVWGPIRTAAPVGAAVAPLDESTWQSLQGSQFEDAFAIGHVRQDHVTCQALLPDPSAARTIVVGSSGSGKSTAMNAAVVEWRNDLARRRVPQAERPAVVVFDAHGDALGRVRDRRDRQRPSLVHCLEEHPIVISRGGLRCRARDLPAPMLLRAVGDLTAAQKRWADTYVIDDEDHQPIEHLVLKKHEPRWPDHFPEFAADGELSKATRDSLVTLRAKILAVLAPPLFSLDAESTWGPFIRKIDDGRTVIVDVSSFPLSQQPLVVILTVKTILRNAEDRLRSGRPVKPVLIVLDEAHRMKAALREFCTAAVEGRKFRVGLLVGSQRIAHFPDDLLTQATNAFVMRSEGKDGLAAVARWPELKPVAAELGRLQPGAGFFISRNIAWPVAFRQPAIIRGLRERP